MLGAWVGSRRFIPRAVTRDRFKEKPRYHNKSKEREQIIGSLFRTATGIRHMVEGIVSVRIPGLVEWEAEGHEESAQSHDVSQPSLVFVSPATRGLISHRV